MGSRKKAVGAVAGIVLAAIIVAVLPSMLFVVGQKQYAAVRRFGKIVRVESSPGLKMKLPFVQTVQKVSAREMLYDVPLSDVITKDKKSMIADCYVLWRVADPSSFIRTLDAIPARATAGPVSPRTPWR